MRGAETCVSRAKVEVRLAYATEQTEGTVKSSLALASLMRHDESVWKVSCWRNKPEDREVSADLVAWLWAARHRQFLRTTFHSWRLHWPAARGTRTRQPAPTQASCKIHCVGLARFVDPARQSICALGPRNSDTPFLLTPVFFPASDEQGWALWHASIRRIAAASPRVKLRWYAVWRAHTAAIQRIH